MKGFIGILTAILFTIMVVAILGFIMWGIGCFMIDFFDIDYVWTYYHGIAAALIIMFLESVF